MKFSVEYFIGLVGLILVAFLVFYKWSAKSTLSQNQHVLAAPLVITDEIKSYIDQKLSSTPSQPAAACAEVPKLMERIRELERKLETFSRINQAVRGLEQERKVLGQMRKQQIEFVNDPLRPIRAQEIRKLKAELLPVCAAASSNSTGVQK